MRQAVAAEVVDELVLDFAPDLLGAGEALFDGVPDPGLEPVEVIECERTCVTRSARGLGNSCNTCSMAARLNPESPGLKRLVEAARAGEFQGVHLVARETLLFGGIWLEPGESFHCGKGQAEFLIDAGSAEQIVNPS